MVDSRPGLVVHQSLMAGPAGDDDRAPGEGYLVLWVGGPQAWEREVQAALSSAGVRVEESGLDRLLERAIQRAPDLVVLAGAAGGAPASALSQLGAAEPASSLPVVAIGPWKDTSRKPRARFGLASRLDRDATPQSLADQLVTLIRTLSRRPARWRVKSTIEDLPNVVSRFAVSRRSGVLSLSGAGALAVDANGNVAPEPALLIGDSDGVLELTFHERPPGRVIVLTEEPRAEETAPGIEGARILIIDDDDERGKKLAAHLEEAGAKVRATGVVSQAIHTARAVDPTLVVVTGPALAESACAPLWEEPRLAAASLLVLDGGILERVGSARLLSTISALTGTELSLRRRLRHREAVVDRLETLGPARWLKVLGQCEHDVSFRVFGEAGRCRVDFTGGKLRGASFHPADGRTPIDGRAAVEALLGLPFGRVLAGPPAALAALDGIKRARHPSTVGTIAPASAPGTPPKRGLVAAEVVVQRTDATSGPRASVAIPRAGAIMTAPSANEPAANPSTNRRTQPLTAQGRERGAERALAGEGEREARTTSPAKARRGLAGFAKGPPRAVRPEPARPEPARPAAVAREAQAVEVEETERTSRRTLPDKPGAVASHATLFDAADDEIPTATYDEAAVSSLLAADAVSTGAGATTPTHRPARRAKSEPPSAEPAFDASGLDALDAASPVAPEAASEAFIPALPEAPAPAALPRPDASPEEPSASAPKAPRSNTVWFVAGTALALAVGGWAVWQMGVDPEASTDIGPVAAGEPLGEPTEPGPTEVEPTPSQPTEAEPTEAEPTEAEPTEAEPTEAEPTEAEPTEAEPTEAEPTEAEPTQLELTSPEPVEAEPTEAEPARAPSRVAVPLSDASALELVRASSDAARARDWERSASLAQQALARSPRNSQAAYRLAVARFRQHRYDEAITWAQRSSELDTEDPLPVSLLGDVHMRVGRFPTAAREYRRALAIDADFEPAQRQLERLRARGVGD